MFIEIYSLESENTRHDISKNLDTFNLSSREKEIINLVLVGKSNKDIAEILDISINTVKNISTIS